ncbi:MAG TPA: hypothetical protein VG844_02915 [Terracidiphilus sp.]|nr:hypothetical protein [Terracidiphilus sp.]
MIGRSFIGAAGRCLRQRRTWMLIATVLVAIVLVLALSPAGHGTVHHHWMAMLPAVFIGIVASFDLHKRTFCQVILHPHAEPALAPNFQRPPPFTFAD